MNKTLFMTPDLTIKRKQLHPETKSTATEQLIGELEVELEARNKLLKELFTEYNKLKEKVGELEQQLGVKQNKEMYEKLAHTWISKIVFTLRHEDRPLRSPDLIGLLEIREDHLRYHHNKVQYFSAFLTQAVRYKRIVAYKLKGVRGYYYLLPEWMNSEEEPETKYKVMML